MRVVFLITGILMCTLLIVGCVQTNSPAEKKTPSVIVTSQTTPGVPNINRLPAAHPDTMPRYRHGDIIDFSFEYRHITALDHP
jgi:hypothetical protein